MGFKFRVRDLMSTDVKTLRMNDNLKMADQLMTMGRIRHLPVLDDEGELLVGVVSQRDLFRGALARALGYGEHQQETFMEMLAIKEVMATDVATIGPGAHVREAARLMLDRKVGCLPVVDGDRLVGILTESDFVGLFAKADD